MRFKRGGTKNEVRGVATYGRFRQFEVGTEEASRRRKQKVESNPQE